MSCTFGIKSGSRAIRLSKWNEICFIQWSWSISCEKMRISAKALSLWVCVVYSMASCVANVEQKIQFANDFVANENAPVALFVRASCWTRSDMVRFVLASNVSVQFIRNSIAEHPINELSNKVMFFIDMSCSKSEQFLFQVRPHSKIVLLSLCTICAKMLFILFFSYQYVHMICWPQILPIRWKNHILRFHTIGFCSMCHWLAIEYCWTSCECCPIVMSQSFITTISRMTMAYNKVRANNSFHFFPFHTKSFLICSLQNRCECGGRNSWRIWQMERRNWIIGSAINANPLAATTRSTGPDDICVDGCDK